MEKRVSDREEIAGDIPRLLNLRFSYVRAQLDALDARMDTVEAKLDRLNSEVKAIPRVVAEMLDERDKRRGGH